MSTEIVLGNVVVDCADAAGMQRFYGELLDPAGPPFCLCRK